MLSRVVTRRFSDFAHKQVSAGFSKKYGENFDKIFGKKPKQSGTGSSSKKDVTKEKSESK